MDNPYSSHKIRSNKMKIEKIINKTSSKTLNIVASQVESLRINDDLKKTVRVYDKGNIGVEGRIGNADFSEMEKAATAKLQQGINYPETHDKPLVKSVDASKHIFDEKEYIPQISALLERLTKENPEFLFSNKISLRERETSYENSDGSNLKHKSNSFMCSLVVKYKGSANIMDESVGGYGDYFDIDELCHDAKIKCDAFLNNLPQVEENEMTIIGDLDPLYQALQHFVADLYFNKASLFDGKLGQKLFSDKFSLFINRDPQSKCTPPFFDTEGVVNTDYKSYLVKNGVFEKVATCKKSANQYNTENLGSAEAEYDSVPNASAVGLDVESTADDLSQIVKGRAVYVSLTSGGDMTPSGDISLPVQAAYLYENGKLLGKLPEFTVTGNVFDIFGKDFLGVCEKGIFKFGQQKYFVYKAKLVNKAN